MRGEKRREERERRRGDREDCRKENSLLVSTALQLLTRSVHFFLSRPVPLLAAAAAVCFICHVAGLCACVQCVSFSCHFSVKADDSSDHLWHCVCLVCVSGGGGGGGGGENKKTLHGADWTCNTYTQCKSIKLS